MIPLDTYHLQEHTIGYIRSVNATIEKLQMSPYYSIDTVLMDPEEKVIAFKIKQK